MTTFVMVLVELVTTAIAAAAGVTGTLALGGSAGLAAGIGVSAGVFAAAFLAHAQRTSDV